MKARKKPTALIVGLGVALAIAFGYNLVDNKVLSTGQPERELLAQQPEQTAPKTDPKTIRDQVNKTVEKTPAKEPDEEGNPKMLARREKPGDPPSILLASEAVANYKPKPNDSSTSTQWYDDNSLNGNK